MHSSVNTVQLPFKSRGTRWWWGIKHLKGTVYLHICIDIIVTILAIVFPVLALLSSHLPPTKAEVNSMWHILNMSL